MRSVRTIVHGHGKMLLDHKWAALAAGLAVLAVSLGAGGCSLPVKVPTTPNQVDPDSKAAKHSHTGMGLHTHDTSLEFRPQPKEIVAGQSSIWSLKVLDLKHAGTGKPKGVASFQVVHEKLMHLIIASRDLSWFNHIHPEYKDYGSFVVQTTIPRAGEYKLYADYTPSKGTQEVAQKTFTVVQATGTAPSAVKPVDLVPNAVVKGWMTNNVGSRPEGEPDAELAEMFEVALKTEPATVRVGEDVALSFQVRNSSHQPVTDLEPYLGAMGHAVILSADTNIYLHAHPHEQGAPTGMAPGEVMFHTSFPQAGLFKIWGQFQHRGMIITAPFVIKVSPADANQPAATRPVAKGMYQCPMDPDQVSAKPGKCQKCGMDLEKV